MKRSFNKTFRSKYGCTRVSGRITKNGKVHGHATVKPRGGKTIRTSF